MDVKCGFAEEFLSALAFYLQQGALDGTDGLCRDIAVFRGVLLGVFGYLSQHGAEVLHVDEQESALVGNSEHDIKNAVLCFVQLHQSGE